MTPFRHHDCANCRQQLPKGPLCAACGQQIPKPTHPFVAAVTLAAAVGQAVGALRLYLQARAAAAAPPPATIDPHPFDVITTPPEDSEAAPEPGQPAGNGQVLAPEPATET